MRFGGVTAVDDVSVTVAPGRGRRPDRAERRGQDDADRRGHRLRAAGGGRDRRSTGGRSAAGPRTGAPASGCAARSSRSSCSRTQRRGENLPVASDPRGSCPYVTDLVRPAASRLLVDRGRGGARSSSSSERPRRARQRAPVRAPPARRRSRARSPSPRRSCCSTSPRPASTSARPRSSRRSSAGSPASGIWACSSSSTTWPS